MQKRSDVGREGHVQWREVMSAANIHTPAITSVTVAVVSTPATTVHHASATSSHVQTKVAESAKVAETAKVGDHAVVSPVAVLLAGLQDQLSTAQPNEFKSLLEGAASSIYQAAQQEGNSDQSKALESIAARLRLAASSPGLSNRTPLSLAALF